jgi:hypothetical protein
MKGYVGSIEKAALKNKTFRTVLYTARNCQLVVMSFKPGEDIGDEVHNRSVSPGRERCRQSRALWPLSTASSQGSRSLCLPARATTSSMAHQAG